MIRPAISVDGHTEETSVYEILAKDLRPLEVELCPVRIGCAQCAGRGNVFDGCFGIKRSGIGYGFICTGISTPQHPSRLLRPSCQEKAVGREIQEQPAQETIARP